jgi:ATP-dependent RNA helicase SUPV3L1/SUV3
MLKINRFSCCFISTKPSPNPKYIKQRSGAHELAKILKTFGKSSFFKKKCYAIGIGLELFQSKVSSFKSTFKPFKTDEMTIDLLKNTVFKQFLKHIKNTSQLPPSSTFEGLMDKADLTTPLDYYPQTRKLSRRIILHIGPTNSGKSFNALKKFQNAQDAVFLGPLRLLAHEVYEKCNSNNVACNLLTGEERRLQLY